MIKKWSYVVAAAATVFGGSILTGCIDNDEPFGITQIRVETANLLKAKQALVEADAASKLAQAELDKANAEIAKIDAEIRKAQAEAEMKLNELEKQAEVAKTQAEAAWYQAQVEDQKAKTQAYIAEQQAKIERYIANTQKLVNTATLEHEKAVYAWEMWKLKDQNNASSILYTQLDAAYGKYLRKLGDYNEKAQTLLDEQKKEAQWNNNLVWQDAKDGNPGAWVHPQDDYVNGLKSVVETQQTNVANTEKAIADAEARIEDLSKVETMGGVYEKWTNLKAELQENNAELANLDVETKEIERENASLKQEIDDLTAKYNALGAKPIAIPAYTFKPDKDLETLGMTQEEVIVPEGVSYTLNDLINNPNNNNYETYIEAYNSAYNKRVSFLLDDNDLKWTEARLNELKRQVVPAQEDFDEANEQWEAAKTVYNMGNTPEVKDLPNETELEKAVEDYNALEAQFDSLKEKLETANTEYNEADNAYSEALNKQSNGETLNQEWKDAQDAYDKAEQEARDARTAAITAAQQKQNAANVAARKVFDNTWDAYYRADREYTALSDELSKYDEGENTELEAKVATAKEALDEATEAANGAWDTYQEALADAQKIYDRAEAAAQSQYVIAVNKALVDREKAEDKWVNAGKDNPDLAAVLKVKNDKEAARDAVIAEINELRATAKELWATLREAYDTQREEIQYTWRYYTISTPTNIDWYVDDIINGWNSTFPTAIAPVLYENDGVYENAKWYLIYTSRQAYGYILSQNYNSNTGFEQDNAFLVPGTDVTVDMMNDLIKKWHAANNPGSDPLKDYQCVQYYVNYGLCGKFGELQSIESDIKKAELYLKTPNAITKALGEIEEHKQALVDSKTNALAERETVKADRDAKQATYDDLFTEINNKQDAITKDNGLIEAIITAIEGKFDTLTDQTAWNTSDKVDPADLQDAINKANEALDLQKSNLEIYKAALEEAQKYLDLFNENPDNIYDFNPYTANIKTLTAELKVAEEELAVLKARVDELQAKYEAAAKQ